MSLARERGCARAAARRRPISDVTPQSYPFHHTKDRESCGDADTCRPWQLRLLGGLHEHLLSVDHRRDRQLFIDLGSGESWHWEIGEFGW